MKEDQIVCGKKFLTVQNEGVFMFMVQDDDNIDYEFTLDYEKTLSEKLMKSFAVLACTKYKLAIS